MLSIFQIATPLEQRHLNVCGTFPVFCSVAENVAEM